MKLILLFKQRVAIPDERFDFLCDKFKPASRVQAYLQITDIAGLVRGASKGEGLGNAFLSHIRAVDAIFHIVRVFEDDDVTHVEGNVDPVRDLQVIADELLIKDEETVRNRIEAVEKILKFKKVRPLLSIHPFILTTAAQEKSAVAEMEVLRKIEDVVCKQRKPVRFVDWKASEIDVVNSLLLLSAKPVVYLVNMSEADFARKRNKWLVKIKQWIDAYAAPYSETLIPFCGALEASLVSAKISEQKAAGVAEEDLHVQAAGTLAKIVKTGYAALDLIYFFTAGSDEVRCWTIRRGTKAPQAAGTIHTDFERGFVCAEVMAFADFHELGSEQACKDAGKYRQQGKQYEVQDGDIMFIRANTASLSKKK